MKYEISDNGNLIIINDSGLRISIINKYNNWFKWDFNQYGTQIYYENYRGIKEN